MFIEFRKLAKKNLWRLRASPRGSFLKKKYKNMEGANESLPFFICDKESLTDD